MCTNKEKQIIANAIKNNPTNISKGLREASSVLKKSFYTARSIYYDQIRNDKVLFEIKGKGKSVINTKNTPVSKSTSVSSLDKKLKVVLSKLPKEVLVDLILQD